jgi:hypothetical protein
MPLMIMLLPAATFLLLAVGEDVVVESMVLEDVWMLEDERVETPVGAFWLTVTLVTGSMGNELAEKVLEPEDEVVEEVEDERTDELEVLEIERLEVALDEVLDVEEELLLLCLVDTAVEADLLLVTLDDLRMALCDVDCFDTVVFCDDVEGFDVGNCLLKVFVFLVEVEDVVEDDDLVEIETFFNVVLTEDMGFFFVDDVVFLVEEVTLIVGEDCFLVLVVFFAAATEEDEAEAWMHLQASLTWAALKPLTVDFEFLLESHDLQYVTGCLLLLFTVFTLLALQAVFSQRLLLRVRICGATYL